MLDIDFIRNQTSVVLEGARKKNRKQIDEKFLNELIILDQQRRDLQQEVDKLRSQQKQASQKIAQLSGEEKQTAIKEMKTVSDQEKEISQKLQTISAQLELMHFEIPNPPSVDVPEGNEEDNQAFKKHGEPKNFDFPIKDHIELGENLDIIDIQAGQASSGARFYYLKGDAVLLQFALIQFATAKLLKHGFTPVIPPVLVREEAMYATGFFPADRNEIYHVNPEDDDLYLVGTSEVPLTMLHHNQIIENEKLPIRYFGYSSCFRREAGSYGKDTRGILRVHQFDKIEMYSFCSPEFSAQEHELILKIEEEILQDLGIPYQVINICAGDLGSPAAKKYDIEGWIPSQDKYRELTSCSNCTDYQARRAKIRYRQADGKIEPLHTLNGTAIAMARMLIAIIENNQQADGSITIPEVLQPHMGGRTTIRVHS